MEIVKQRSTVSSFAKTGRFVLWQVFEMLSAIQIYLFDRYLNSR